MALWATVFGLGETALPVALLVLGDKELLAAFLKTGLAAATCRPAGLVLAPPTSLLVREAVFTFDVARFAEEADAPEELLTCPAN